MEAYAKPMRELADALSWFVRARELRLLYVVCDGELRTTAIRITKRECGGKVCPGRAAGNGNLIYSQMVQKSDQCVRLRFG